MSQSKSSRWCGSSARRLRKKPIFSVSAEEEFNIERLHLVEAEKKKIRQEYERKERQVEIRKKIEYSMQLNASRIKVLQVQDDMISSMKEAASKELLNVSHHHHLNLLSRHHHEYRNLLKDLIVQIQKRLFGQLVA